MSHPYEGTPYEKFVTLLEHKRKTKSGDWEAVITPYMPVDGRITEAKDEAIKAGASLNISSTIVVDDEKVLVMRATVMTARGTSVGTSAIYKGKTGGVGGDNPYEVCETSAVGRALGFQGYGLMPHNGIATGEDIQRATAKNAQPVDAIKYWRDERAELVKSVAMKVRWFKNTNQIAEVLAAWEKRGHIQRDQADDTLFDLLNGYANQQADKKAAK